MIIKAYNKISDFLEDSSFINWAKDQKLSDKQFWDYWLTTNPDKKELAYEARDIILGIQFNTTSIPQEKINLEWNKFASKINKNSLRPVKEKNNTFIYKWAGIAASLLLCATVSIYFITKTQTINHSTGYGEILDLKLKDGTTVKLNANSSISYTKDDIRKIKLKGEAFFEVVKKTSSNAKFWVTTNDLEVEVYGTVFNVNTHQQKTQVYLEEGSIRLALKNGTSKKMIPGNFVSYSAKENKILEEKKLVLSSEKTSWKDGTLVFTNLSLEKAMQKVTDTYGYEVIFKNKLNKHTLITGSIPTTNIDICIKAIEKSVNVKIIKENTKLVVYKK